mgnify:CR=1 FL=1
MARPVLAERAQLLDPEPEGAEEQQLGGGEELAGFERLDREGVTQGVITVLIAFRRERRSQVIEQVGHDQKDDGLPLTLPLRRR